MLGGLPRTQKNDRHIVIIESVKLGVFVDIYFSEVCAKFLEQRRDPRLGLFAKMASGTRIDRNVERARELQASIFGPRVCARLFRRAQPPALDQSCHRVAYGG